MEAKMREPPRRKARNLEGESSRDVGQAIVRSTPGWLISVAIHGLIIFAATLFYFDHYRLDDDTALYAQIVKPRPKLSDLEQPPEEKKPPKEDATSEDEAAENSLDPGSQTDAGSDAGADAGSDLAAGGDPLGVAGGTGSGGWRPSRAAARAAVVKRPRRAAVVDPVVRGALRWLARHQEPDGSWSCTQFHRRCAAAGLEGDCARNELAGNEQYSCGITGLALLAFLGAGYTPMSKEVVSPGDRDERDAKLPGEERERTYGEVVKRSCRYLMAAQAPSGRIGPEVDRFIYNHVIGTLALSEAYGNSGIWILRKPVERALQLLMESRQPEAGWRYGSPSRDTDASVTGWVVLCLRSAEAAGLTVDRSVANDLHRWFDRATVATTIPVKSMGDPSWDAARTFTLTGYTGPKDAGSIVSVHGLNEHYQYTPAMTAVTVISALLLDVDMGAKMKGALETLQAFPPVRWSAEDRSSWRQVDLYYLYHATYAFFLASGKDDEVWKRWSDAARTALAEAQHGKAEAGKCLEGSWDPVDRWACEGGRVYATALGVLTLELCHRYPRILALTSKERSVDSGTNDSGTND